ncbi:hypothetical protein [Amycolatopsis sp. H20-H5]|uniref:hypothetical protein n=1 Tax=Amycolatopsis sp. H20-H5 TaxID=3046309 RepID=UPI002DB813E0|nr:hypothetical protein [Amycolatopsis sp. H20-H5]MEC3977315.1 hypothetical protein [Amycolatopsis sp. H20-H5]
MLKKICVLAAGSAACMVLLGGVASAGEPGGHEGHHNDGQVGLVNSNNLDVLHNVNGTLGFCDNDVNVLGVQVPVRHSGNGLGIPLLSPGLSAADSEQATNCASGGIESDGSSQHS